jgi:hypothetical protein
MDQHTIDAHLYLSRCFIILSQLTVWTEKNIVSVSGYVTVSCKLKKSFSLHNEFHNEFHKLITKLIMLIERFFRTAQKFWGS